MSVDDRFASILTELSTLRRSQREDRPLSGDGGGATPGGVSEDWKESVERRLGDLHKDLRGMLYIAVCAVVALATMIAGLYLRTDAKFEEVNTKLAKLEVIEVRLGKIDGDVARIEAKLDKMNERQATAKR
jgi:hypothetical protein